MTLGLIEKAFRRHDLSAEEMAEVLGRADSLPALLKAADETRRAFVGETIYLRGLVEFGNRCKNQCLYCGLRAGQKGVERYRLSPSEILENAALAKKLGYATVVLQSGEEDGGDEKDFLKVIEGVAKLGLILTLSIGEKTFGQYAAYKKSGAARFLLRIETSDPALYANFHPGLDFQKRVECLKNLKSLGYELGTGMLVGLPGQSDLSLARDILFFKKIGADMVGLGPFIPTPGTPLEGAAGGTFEKALMVMALTRLMLPEANIPATTALEALKPQGRLLALQSGANVIMPNVTVLEARRKYALYPGKAAKALSPAQTLKKALQDIAPLGRPTDLAE